MAILARGWREESRIWNFVKLAWQQGKERPERSLAPDQLQISLEYGPGDKGEFCGPEASGVGGDGSRLHRQNIARPTAWKWERTLRFVRRRRKRVGLIQPA